MYKTYLISTFLSENVDNQMVLLLVQYGRVSFFWFFVSLTQKQSQSFIDSRHMVPFAVQKPTTTSKILDLITVKTYTLLTTGFYTPRL